MSKFKFQSSKCIDEPPAPTNGEQAMEAEKYIQPLGKRKPIQIEFEHIQDAITNLLHLSDREGFDTNEVVRRAVFNWKEER